MGKLAKKYLVAFLVALAMVQVAYAASTKFTNVEVTGTLTVDGNQTNSGSQTVTGNQTVSGNTTISGNETVTGNQTVTGKNILTRSSITGVTVSTTVAASAPFEVLTSSSGPITMTATPAISTTTATDGQLLVLKGVSATNTFTLQDQGTLNGSLVELGASTRVISDKKVLMLLFDGTLGEWLEMSYGNN